ncbi:MAG TPA: TAXI family TRAP transporter solute-binding subunit [Burkholderiales bacterium]|nr:TAXI family TRAP transporter solute-binding subunit [Betaproteobacteria bacterium]HQR53086.1 TAXI family TRAP transporter solute-binding subunit [Burkholderiales bacterium]
MKRRLLALVGAFISAVIALYPATAPAAEPNWPPSLTVATASPGGTYHAYGEGLALLLTRSLDVPVAEQTTEGPRENIQLIEAGDAQIGFVTMGVALQGWNGTGDWTHGKRFQSMRALFPMYDTPFAFVVPKDSPIQSLAGMAGKRIGVGPAGGTAGTYMPLFLATFKIEAELVHGTWDEMADQFLAGKLDALAAAVGAPFPALSGLDARKAIRFVPLSEKEIVSLRLAMPELTPSVIPAGVYPSLLRGYRTVGLYNFAVASKDLPDDLAYAIVDAVFTNQDVLIRAHPVAAETVRSNFSHNGFLPYHPGALRYYSNLATSGTLRGD